MKARAILTAVIISLCLLSANAIGQEPAKMQAAPEAAFTAVGGAARDISLGSLDPDSEFMFLIELTTKGAAIKKATLSKFDDRRIENRQPLVLLAPANKPDGTETYSMANEAFFLVDKQLMWHLDNLNWISLDIEKSDGNQTAVFEAIIKDKSTNEPAIKLTKTYRVTKNSYEINCDLTIENLSSTAHDVNFGMSGPLGIQNEDPRADTRRIVAAFRNIEGEGVSTALDIKKSNRDKTDEQKKLSIKNAGFLWASVTNKYFAAILIPTPDQNTNFCNWLTDKSGWFANHSGYSSTDIGEGNIGIDFKTTTFTIAAAGSSQSSRKLDFRLFVGPKDNSLFEKNPLYKSLGFIHTIDFMACCCPQSIIYPLGFGILALMKWLYTFIPNYGIVIIILVLLVRLILHPLTRKSQISMSEYAKFNSLPEVVEIRKKYAKDIMEMNRHIAEVQKKHGVSHSAVLMGMLPMLVQMPIWIALYGAIYASIDLRGAQFLPFWITDLSAPDALFRFTAFNVPLFGRIDSFNLLPILMGIAFYLQQKLIPSQAAATTPEAAQQQKIMMIMMPVMFPMMLYTSPSGLNLYIMASTFGGVMEQYIIKKHIDQRAQQKEQGMVAVTSKTGGKAKKPKSKPFFKI